MYEMEKKKLIEFAVRVFREQMVQGTGGNLSIVTSKEKGHFIITPSGMPYESLQVSDIVVIDFEGNIVEGNRKPSIEKDMHRLIYINRPDIDALMHTHAVHSTAISITHKPLPQIESTIVFLGGDIECAEYARHGSMDLANNAVKALGKRGAVLLANHGLIVVADTLDTCYEQTVAIEQCAKMYIYASAVGTPIPITDEKCDDLRNYASESYGQGDSTGSTSV